MQTKVGDRILLVGTAHISEKSVEEVRKAITDYKPDIVAVELCKDRYIALRNKRRWENTSVIDVLRSGKGFLVLIQTFLAMIQRRLGKELGVEPGSEMLAAIKEARKADIEVALVDRKITVTFRRAWRSMTIGEKFKLVWHSMKALVGYDRALEEEEIDLEELMKEDMISMMMEELRNFIPHATYALIDERDMYIAKQIKTSAEANESDLKPIIARKPKKKLRSLKNKKKDLELKQAEKKKIKAELKPAPRKVLAVVGAGHLKGIKKHLEKPEKIPELSELEKVPPKRISILKLIGWLIPILFFAMFAWLLYTGEWWKMQEMFLWWFLINGICSAIGALAAKGHPLTIGTAFVAAPFTSLNPAIGAGWVAGYVEAKVRNPTVKDVRELSTVETLKEFFNNSFIRVLMVMALANVGSMVGTIIAFPYITSIFLS
ncbi:MAG: TraB/GumN family protein [Thermoplasmata archaeon]|nr:MAG: TraB/GumN family protein [Thermoplasmata archaeon]